MILKETELCAIVAAYSPMCHQPSDGNPLVACIGLWSKYRYIFTLSQIEVITHIGMKTMLSSVYEMCFCK